MRIINLAGNKISFKKYVNDNCILMVDDLKLIKKQYEDFDMKEAFKILVKHAYIKNIKEPRAKLSKLSHGANQSDVELIEMVDDKNSVSKMINIIRLKKTRIF